MKGVQQEMSNFSTLLQYHFVSQSMTYGNFLLLFKQILKLELYKVRLCFLHITTFRELWKLWKSVKIEFEL